MCRLFGWLSLASLCGLFSLTLSAADPVPNATRHVPSAGIPGSPEPKGPYATGAKQTKPGKQTVPTFAERMQTVQQEQQRAAEESRPKPTQWQLQNPANPSNNFPTEMPQTIPGNNYFGAQFRTWSNVTHPAPMTQLPFNQTATTPINQTNLYTAPNVYFGSQFSGWSNLRTGSIEPNPFGGWNYR